MRLIAGVVLTAVCSLFAFFASAPAVQKENPKTALETDSAGWVDLMPSEGLRGWKRVAIAPDEKLNAKNPWKLSADGKILGCDGVGVKEMLLHDREVGDGIFHIEWHFRKADGKQFNSGIYVRNSRDGKIWHQAQVAHVEKAPFMGDLFADTLVDGQTKRVVITGKGKDLINPPGEWNTYEIACKGKNVTVFVNGTEATKWSDCQVPNGHLGMQAEFFYIDFRNLKFKPLK